MLLLEFKDFFLEGFINTLVLCLAIVTGATLFAIVLAAGMSLRSFVLSRLFHLLAEVFRALPLIVTVLLIYFVLPALGISLDPFWSTTLSVSLWGGANGSHAIRAGLTAVPNAQRETAMAFGLRGWKGLVFVVLPQAMPVILPPYISLVTAWVQASSLGAVVGVSELFRSGQIVIEQTTISRGGSPAFLIYGMILIVYFFLCWAISLAARPIEQYFSRHNLVSVKRAGAGGPAGSATAAVASVDGRT
ncbi:amino acid ABC transporter permease [Neorhizobium galegae]|uniref:amino acid ABC transporter permease n=1 Tax=Neorhizobium galegae TaxID=399 RepID=UPI0006229344|nr:amino acid ABC transporter permease [Neorhizobium galegae]CDZ55166.1 Amine acid ABC transporter, permease protein, 3-TM region, His/Glu/Gln/Arg/opine family [Neorhizobium galegae bv. orientalis]